MSEDPQPPRYRVIDLGELGFIPDVDVHGTFGISENGVVAFAKAIADPANRIEFTRGRDLVVEPGPQSGPINFLAYPLLETSAGTLQSIDPFFSFQRHTDTKDDSKLATQ